MLFYCKKEYRIILVAWISFLLFSCASKNPEPVRINLDNCTYCHQKIKEQRFSCAIVTSDNFTNKFDDIICMLKYSNKNKTRGSYYCGSYCKNGSLYPANQMYYLLIDSRGSTDRNIAAFDSYDSAAVYSSKLDTPILNWESLW